MKKLLTIGVGLLGVGLIILGVAYALIGGDLRKTATDSKFEEKQTTFQTADIKPIKTRSRCHTMKRKLTSSR